MNSISKQKYLLMTLKRYSAPITGVPINQIGVGFGGQLQQVRRIGPIVGPPQLRLSTAQKAIYGWGSLIFMMIIPIWTLYQMPYWSALHNNKPFDENEPKQQEQEQE